MIGWGIWARYDAYLETLVHFRDKRRENLERVTRYLSDKSCVDCGESDPEIWFPAVNLTN